MAIGQIQRGRPVAPQQAPQEQRSRAGIAGAHAIGIRRGRITRRRALHPARSRARGGARFAPCENDGFQIKAFAQGRHSRLRLAGRQLEQIGNCLDFLVVQLHKIRRLTSFRQNLRCKQIHAQIHIKNLQRRLGLRQKCLRRCMGRRVPLAHAAEAHSVAGTRQPHLVIRVSEMIPRRVHHDLITRRAVHKTHQHLPGRLCVIHLHILQRQSARLKFRLQPLPQIIRANPTEQHPTPAQRIEQLMRLYRDVQRRAPEHFLIRKHIKHRFA